MALVPVGSAVSTGALAAATVGLNQLSLEDPTALGAVGWSVVDGAGSPDELATTRRERCRWSGENSAGSVGAGRG